MKKSLSAGLAFLLSLLFISGISGCTQSGGDETVKDDGETVKNDDETVKYDDEPVYKVDVAFGESNCRYAFNSYKKYTRFMNDEYLRSEDEAFWLWSPVDDSFGFRYNSEGYFYNFRFDSFEVYAQKDESGLHKTSKIVHHFMVYPAWWNGFEAGQEFNDYEAYHIGITIISVPADETDGEMEFVTGKRGGKDDFANVYRSGRCIATAYFTCTYDGVTADFLKDYLKNHLFLW